MTERIIESPEQLELWIRFLRSRPLPITVSTVDGRDRTKDQNALQWLWATEVAHQLGDRGPDEVQREWKLRHGVPILREDSADFRAIYDQTLKPLPYELKVEVMRFVPVTSEMKVRQMVRYLDAIERECASMGLCLTDPDPEFAKYLARYRQAERKAA
ncbi:hypothetical protein [Novosphingobium sp. M1R2S20]|uniref:NinB protein n=1 Tax=Novosphingobium rhizovicinum TaxID=3228928 RepID=A0ABV3RDY9_9SPHN